VLVTKLMLKNKFTGTGVGADVVGEFINGELNGLGATPTQTGQFKEDKPFGYIIDNHNEVTYTNDDGDTTRLITVLDNGDIWIGDNFGILVRKDGSTSTGYKRIILEEYCND